MPTLALSASAPYPAFAFFTKDGRALTVAKKAQPVDKADAVAVAAAVKADKVAGITSDMLLLVEDAPTAKAAKATKPDAPAKSDANGAGKPDA